MDDLIRTYMTLSPIVVDADDPLADAAQLMRERRIRHLPVMRGRRLVGVLTQLDLHIAVLEKRVALATAVVSEAMSSKPFVVAPNTPLDQVVRGLVDGRHPCAIVSDGERVHGIFTAVDALRAPKRMGNTH